MVQVYVNLAPLADRTIPCVYTFLQRKTQDTYEILFRAIESRCNKLQQPVDPDYVMSDFEAPVIQAVQQVFGIQVIHRSWYFHLTQSTWPKIQELGLSVQKRNDDEFRLFCGMIDGLAFLPVNDVQTGVAHLRRVAPAAALPLLNYFDETYVTGSTRSGPRQVRIVPPCFLHQCGSDHRRQGAYQQLHGSFQPTSRRAS